jgi:hypothetical protein
MEANVWNISNKKRKPKEEERKQICSESETKHPIARVSAGEWQERNEPSMARVSEW